MPLVSDAAPFVWSYLPFITLSLVRSLAQAQDGW
jgi:hypothetical protein